MKIFHFSSLQTALTVRFVLAATLPLLIFGWFGYDRLLKQKETDITLDLQGHAQSIRTEISEFIDELQYELRIASDTVDLLAEGRPADVDRFLKALVEGADYFEAVYLLDNSGHVRSLGVSSRLGINRDDYLDADFSHLELLGTPLQEDRPQEKSFRWSDTFVSPLTGKPTIMLATVTKDGQILGTIPLDRLNHMLERRLRQTESMSFAVIDRHGTLIAHTNAQLAMERSNLSALHPEILGALASGREIPPKMHEDASLLESVYLIPKTGWVIHSSVAQDYIRAQGLALRTSLFSAVVGAVLLGGGLAFWMARRLNRPLHELRTSAQELANGSVSGFHLRGVRYAELDDLSGHLRNMAAAVLEREANLKSSEERYRSVVSNLGEGLMTIDSDGIVTECNPSAERILGRRRQELIDRRIDEEFGEVFREDGSRILLKDSPFIASLQRGEMVENHLVGLHRHDGLEIWLQINSRPQWAREGKIAAAVVSFTDVTSLKLVEESLRRGKERFEELYQQFQALLEGISDRISLITPELVVLWSNQDSGAVCMSEFASQQGDCCYQRFFGRIEPCPSCPVVRCVAKGEAVFEELTDSHGRIWNLRAFPVMSAQFEQGVRQVVLMAEDITEKRTGEQQRMRANQLAALGELAAGVAHEINNPISGVINYAQLIANATDEGSRENDMALRIIKEGDRIATIVRELLVFARSESQEVQKVSVREAIGEALTLCEASLRKEQIILCINLPADLPKVESRSHQIEQLFLNLLVNARHALTDRYLGGDPDKVLEIGGESITIKGHGFVRVRVRDHGSGIPAAHLAKVMNPFFTTKPAGVGTGLGLSISFEIAKRHGGSLQLFSEHGQWTEAVVDLPVAE